VVIIGNKAKSIPIMIKFDFAFDFILFSLYICKL